MPIITNVRPSQRNIFGTHLINFINFHQPIPVATQRSFDPLHCSQHFLFLQSLAHYLDRHWKAMHSIRVVELVCTFGHSVQLPKVEIGWELIELAIYSSNWNDTTWIIQLYAK